MTSTSPITAETSCIFCQIIHRQAPGEIIYQDELVTAFENIRPVTPLHILVVPNHHISSANDVSPTDEASLGRMITVASRIAAQRGIAQNGYRLIINTGNDGGQSVFHLHLHLLGGKHLGFKL